MEQNAPRIEDGDEFFDIPTFMSRNYVSRTLVFREIAADGCAPGRPDAT